MAFKNSSSIDVDTKTVSDGGTIAVHFDLSFNSAPSSMSINYSISGSCAVFQENNGTTLSHTKSGLGMLNNVFNDPITFSGNCQDTNFVLKVDCVTSDDDFPKSFPITFNPPVTAMALHPQLEAKLMKNVNEMIDRGVKSGIEAHVKAMHGKPAKKAARKAPAKKTRPTGKKSKQKK